MSIQWNQISTIFFDVGNTLFFLDHPRIIQEARSLGYEISPNTIAHAEAAARKAVDGLFEKDPETDDIAVWRGFFGTVLTTLGISKGEFEHFRDRFSIDTFESSMWTLSAPDVPEVRACTRSRSRFRVERSGASPRGGW